MFKEVLCRVVDHDTAGLKLFAISDPKTSPVLFPSNNYIALKIYWFKWSCGEPAISLHSHTVPLVPWSTRLLPVMRDPGSIPRGVLMWNDDSPVSVVSLHWCIGDPDVIDHCGLVWGGLCPELSLGCHADNVMMPLDLIHSSSVPVPRLLQVLLPASQLT